MSGFWPGCCCGASVLTFGGTGAGGTRILDVEEYSVSGDSWSSLNNLPSLSRPHMYTSYCLIGDGTHAVGGEGINSAIYLQGLNIHVASTDSWSSGTAYPIATQHHFPTSASNESGEMHVFGGNTSPGAVTASHRKYSSSAWSSLTSLGAGRYGHDTRKIGTNGTFLFGGFDSGINVAATVDAYSSGSDSFSGKTAMTAARARGSCFYDDDYAWYVGGADTGLVAKNTNYRYDASGNSWSTLGTAPGNVVFHAAMTADTSKVMTFGLTGTYDYDSGADSFSALGTRSKSIQAKGFDV